MGGTLGGTQKEGTEDEDCTRKHKEKHREGGGSPDNDEAPEDDDGRRGRYREKMSVLQTQVLGRQVRRCETKGVHEETKTVECKTSRHNTTT